MKLQNHIAYRFLTDPYFTLELISTMYPDYYKRMMVTPKEKWGEVPDNVAGLYNLLVEKGQKAYYITETVLDKLDLLKVRKVNPEPPAEAHYDWTVFNKVSDRKVTFIFPDNGLLRLQVVDKMLCFCHLRFKLSADPQEKKHGKGTADWVMWYTNRFTGEECDHSKHDDVRAVEEFVYKLLCFMYLTDTNEEVIVPAGGKSGTKKQGKVLNDTPFPVTIVNSNWNITSIRTEGFPVNGHIAIRWTGPGRTIPKLVLIEPFQKHGYTRKAKSKEEA